MANLEGPEIFVVIFFKLRYNIKKQEVRMNSLART